jgi:glucose/mannose-6-phosphate isomerase
LDREVQVTSNSAKRLAGQLVDRHVVLMASGFMGPVARRWKCQINEVAKAVAAFEYLPEADHNTLAGIYFPETILEQVATIFLYADQDHPRNQKRVLQTRQIMLEEGLNTDVIEARGSSRLSQMWTTILFGDYVAYYLALLYEVDPTAIPPISTLKDAMSK